MPTATTGQASTGAPAPDTGALTDALRQLRDALAGTRFRFATPSADSARDECARLVGQLDDYLLPRLGRLDAPLLVVVGGSTGAGKSTLVNSLVRAPVSPAGVLRPTTRSPLLAGNPADAPWFAERRLLPSFPRSADRPDPAHPHHAQLQLIAAPALPAGVALLDAPDIDSVVADNRDLAAELMDAADLWLFVTTASRYADAVPWDVLETARDRGVQLAVVINRVPPGGERPVGTHLAQLMAQAGLTSSPLFVLPEAVLDQQGLLPDQVVDPIRSWFLRLAEDGGYLGAVARQTVDGAVRALTPRCQPLIEAVTEQSRAATVLRTSIIDARGHAVDAADAALSRGALLHGEPLARWQALADGGELLHALRARAGRLRDSLVATLAGRPVPGRAFRAALDEALTTTIADAVTGFDHRVTAAWTAEPAGAALLAHTDPPPDPGELAATLVADWHRELLDLIRNDTTAQRTSSRRTTYPMSALELLTLVAVFVDPARTTPALRTAPHADDTRDLLDATVADPTVRRVAPQARDFLRTSITTLLDTHRQHFVDLLDPLLEPSVTDIALRAALSEVNRAHSHTPLVPTATPRPPATTPKKPHPTPPPEHPHPKQPPAEEAHADNPEPEQPQAEHPQPEEIQAEQAHAEQAQPEEIQAEVIQEEEAQVQGTQVEGTQVERGQAEQPQEELHKEATQDEAAEDEAPQADAPSAESPLPPGDAQPELTQEEDTQPESPQAEETQAQEAQAEDASEQEAPTEEAPTEVAQAEPTETDVPEAADPPESDVSETEVPSSDIPSSDAPSSDVPSAEVPSVEVPSAEVSSAEIASAEVPSADVPSSDVSEGGESEGEARDGGDVADNDPVGEDVGAGEGEAGGAKSGEARS